jgi:hypothetical protein
MTADLDLTAVIDEACAALSHRGMWIGPRKAKLFLEAALPEIRKALAPEVEQAIRDHPKPTIYGCEDQKLGTDYPKHVVEKWLEAAGGTT